MNKPLLVKREALEEALENFLSNYEKVRQFLFIKVINQELNQEKLKDLVHKSHYEFAITCHIDVSHVLGVHATIDITDRWAEALGVDPEWIIEDAITNSITFRKPDLLRMSDFKHPLFPATDSNIPMYVLTNKHRRNGASVVFYPGLLAALSRSAKENLLLIPSSVHEFIFFFEDEWIDIDEINSLIKSINTEILDEKEVLSDQLYRYDREKDEIRPVLNEEA